MSFAEIAEAYRQQIAALVEGGVDLLLIETVFDTLNAKAAIWAARRHAADSGTATPLMVSGTITDRSGRTLSGQTVSAFWQSVRHARPLTIGLNCALGGAEMRPFIQELASLADTLVCAYPNAGLPNALGCYDETPDRPPRRCASSRARVSSTSSVAAAAPHPTTLPRSPPQSPASHRGTSPTGAARSSS